MAQLLHNSTLYPYTTLFRSTTRRGASRGAGASHHRLLEVPRPEDPCVEEHADQHDRHQHERQRGGGRVVGDDEERSEEHTSELQSPCNLVCRHLLEKKNTI